MNWVREILQTLFFWLDQIIYGFIPTFYNLFTDIAETTIFTDEIIDLFASKVYALLGIFMLFKVSFSILTYIVNPDEFADKNKGFGKLITNVMITLTLLVATPWIFTQAMNIQRIILRDNIIGKIFSITENNTNVVSNPGDLMAYETLKAFYHVDTTVLPSCKNIMDANCASEFAANVEGDASGFYQTLTYAETTNSVWLYMDFDLVNLEDKSGNYVMSYTPLISTVAGGAIALLLILFCFDIAVRSIKLGFLRMLAPVPIVSRIDPKKGKETFDKWLKACINTYLDLFIRLLSIYFAVFVISIITTNIGIRDAVTGATKDVNLFVIVFIIIGALLFAKQLPQLIYDMLGVKLDGKFTLSPFKKVGEVPLVGNLAARGIGAAGSMIAGQGFKSGWQAGGKAVSWKGDSKSITGGLTRFTDEGRKNRVTQKAHNLGEKLYAENSNQPYDIYKGTNAQAYGESVKSVDDAKSRRDTMQGIYERKKMEFESRRSEMSEEEIQTAIADVDKARIDSLKAASDYDKVKKAHDYMRSQDARNAQIEDAFNSAKDANEAKDRVERYVNLQSQPAPSAQPVNQNIGSSAKQAPTPLTPLPTNDESGWLGASSAEWSSDDDPFGPNSYNN